MALHFSIDNLDLGRNGGAWGLVDLILLGGKVRDHVFPVAAVGIDVDVKGWLADGQASERLSVDGKRCQRSLKRGSLHQ